jgi:predicted nucleic acid-binding protein
MIIMDTDVLSELMRPAPDETVEAWAKTVASELFLTAVTVAEIHFGILRMPGGRRRYELTCDAEALLTTFSERTLPFDRAAAMCYPTVVVSRKAGGRPISILDAQIAAICRARGAELATRNVKDFEHLGLTVIDPWNP